MKRIALFLASVVALSAAPITVTFDQQPQHVYPGGGFDSFLGTAQNDNPQTVVFAGFTGSMAQFLLDNGFQGGPTVDGNSTFSGFLFIMQVCGLPPCSAPGLYEGDIQFRWRLTTSPVGQVDFLGDVQSFSVLVTNEVPEPSTWLMLAIGLVAIVWRSRAAKLNRALRDRLAKWECAPL